MNSETFGERIRRLRKEQDMSLRELASALNYDQSSLSKIERNELTAPEELIRPMADKLKDDYRELMIKYLSERVFYLAKESDFAMEALEEARKRLEKEGRGTVRKLKRAKLIDQIVEYLSSKPVDKAWLFGSFARDEESADSDIDILVRFMRPNKLDLIDYIGMKQELENLSGRQVDFVEEGFLLPNAEENVAKEKVLIYEKKAG